MNKAKKIKIWGFRIPLLNEDGTKFGDEWVLFDKPLVVKEKELKKFSQECISWRIFFKDMRQKADVLASRKGDVWDQFYWSQIDAPKNIGDFADIYMSALPDSIKTRLY